MKYQRKNCPWTDSRDCVCSDSIKVVNRIFTAHYEEWFRTEFNLWESLKEDFDLSEREDEVDE